MSPISGDVFRYCPYTISSRGSWSASPSIGNMPAYAAPSPPFFAAASISNYITRALGSGGACHVGIYASRSVVCMPAWTWIMVYVCRRGPAHGLGSWAGAVCVRGQCGRQMIHLTKNNRTFRLTCASFQPRHWYMYHDKTLAIDDVPNFRLAALSPQSPRRREPEHLARSAPRANCVLGSGSLPLD